MRPLLLAMTGCIALTLGLFVYLADRGPSHATLVPDVALFGGRHLFGTFGQWLPSAAHPLAFSLFTAAALKPGIATRLGACGFWAAVNVAFECGQHPAFRPLWLAALHGGAGDGAFGRPLLNYFLQGTFDLHDVSAAMLGALAAGVFLHFVDQIQETHHAPN